MVTVAKVASIFSGQLTSNGSITRLWKIGIFQNISSEQKVHPTFFRSVYIGIKKF